MKFTKIHAFLLIIALLAASGSYAAGRGINVSRAITESRCSAGAFIAHSKKPSTVQADAHSDETVALSNVSGQVASAGYAPVQLTGPNLIANGNLETMGPDKLPLYWGHNTVGNNNGRFGVVRGASSATGVRVDISAYTDGTADWFGPKLTPVPGAYYQFQDNYRSNVVTRAVLMLKTVDGREEYINLAAAPTSEDWGLYTERFFVPFGTTQMQISHPLDQAGWLETDNYTLRRATPAGFPQAMVSLTFDDGWRSIHDNALPLMDKYGVVSTQYIVTGLLGQLKEYMTPGMLYDFERTGHEIASHSVDHPDLTQLTDVELAHQITVSKANLTKCYRAPTDFAPPYGAANARTISALRPLYQTSRSTETGFNTPDTLNPYQLRVQNITSSTTPAEFKAWLDTARQNKSWLILVYHQIDTNAGEFTRKPADFEKDLMAVNDSGVLVQTVHNAYMKTQENKGG